MQIHFSALVLVLVLTAIVYGQTWHFDFVNYDDASYVYDNPHIVDGLTVETARWAMTTRYFGNWIPVTWLSYLVDVSVFGVEPGALHVHNAVGHAVNALLLYFVVFLYTKRLRISLLLALIFVVHPMHVESVAWISERKDILSTLFGLLCLIGYQRYATNLKSMTYLITLMLFGFSLMAKPMLITLPVILLILDYYPLERFGDLQARKRVFFEKIPFVLLSIGDIFVTIWTQSGINAIQSSSTLPFSERLPNAIHSYGMYMVKFFIPHSMIPFYPHSQGTLGLLKPALALVLLIAITVVCWHKRKTRPAAMFGWAWYLITLVPVIGIVQVGGQAMADRYTYIPYIGFSIFVVAVVTSYVGNSIPKRNGFLAITVMWLVMLTTLAIQQTSYWKNSVTLFTHTIEHSPDNMTALTNLGEAYLNIKGYEKADDTIRYALSVMPNSIDNLRNMAQVYRETNRLSESEAVLRNALVLNPKNSETLNHLAMTLLDSHRPTEAVPLLHEALELNPEYSDAHNNLGNALLTMDDIDTALFHFTTSLELKPNQAETWSNLGAAYLMKPDFERAVEPLQRSLELDPENAVTLTNYAVSLMSLGNVEGALVQTQHALEIDPGYVQAQGLLEHLKSTR
jgi:protein O-mannosyl-transferase